MKLISDHLGQIIAALAAVCLLITSVVYFKAPIGDFFGNAVTKETGIGDKIVGNLDDVDVTTLQIKLLNGNKQVYNSTTAAALSFCSNANIADFKEVKVDGAVVASSNYTVTEGSTIVTFTEAYSSALADGNHTIEIVSKSGTAAGTFSVESSGIIPEGGTYTVEATNTVLSAGDSFPDSPADGDTYEYGDYRYSYSSRLFSGGWLVTVLDSSKTEYGVILERINSKPVNRMDKTFYYCTSLTTAPTIPSGVTNMKRTFFNCTSLTSAPTIPRSVSTMESTFSGCTSLTTAPTIPSGVTNMKRTFFNCTSLTSAPTIPRGVIYMNDTFYYCTLLTGTIEINANPNVYEDCLRKTQITGITGSCSQATKDALMATK